MAVGGEKSLSDIGKGRKAGNSTVWDQTIGEGISVAHWARA